MATITSKRCGAAAMCCATSTKRNRPRSPEYALRSSPNGKAAASGGAAAFLFGHSTTVVTLVMLNLVQHPGRYGSPRLSGRWGFRLAQNPRHIVPSVGPWMLNQVQHDERGKKPVPSQ